ncbi:MAG: ribonuclease Z [Thaumarchaeota archaeon]|nr:ribonuclease Z [Nitrososphaerota archaeon]
MASSFKIHFFGTSSAVPTKERGLSCLAIIHESSISFFDCGEGSQRAVINAGLGFNKDCNIFITHMHGDHVVGLLGILQTMAMNRREKPVKVFGPRGIVEFIRENQAILKFGLTFDILAKEVKSGLVFDEKNSKFRVHATRSEHSTLSFSYLFEEKEKPGRFHPDRAQKLGIPEGPLWSKLQHGENVALPGSRKKISPDQVLDESRPGKRIGVSGDTRPSESLEKFFKNTDVLIFDSTYSDKNKENAIENMHSTSREAALLARKARVRQLILTHFSARYRSVSHLVKEAREEFPNTIAARDMMVYDLSTLS